MPADEPRSDREVPLPNIRQRVDASADRMTEATADEPSLGELLRRLTDETSDLLQQEVELAKAEVRETAQRLTRDTTRMGLAAALSLAGALTLTAWLVIAVAVLLDGRYGWAALLVGSVVSGLGYGMITRALRDIRERGVAPRETIASLREDAAWARNEARELRKELTGNGVPSARRIDPGSDRPPPSIRP